MIGDDFPDVLRQAREGDHTAIERLYLDLVPIVTGYARAHGAHSPDDLAGDVFVTMVRRLGSFVGDERGFRSWILTIAHRRVVDELRRRQRRKATVPLEEVHKDLIDLTDHENQALARLRAQGVLAVIENLTDDQRAVLLLRTLADLPVDEVAEIVGKPATAVKALHRRALQNIRRTLHQQEDDDDDLA